MADPLAIVGQPRFNHVAMSMPADALDANGRREILAFFVEGWESPHWTKAIR